MYNIQKSTPIEIRLQVSIHLIDFYQYTNGLTTIQIFLVSMSADDTSASALKKSGKEE